MSDARRDNKKLAGKSSAARVANTLREKPLFQSDVREPPLGAPSALIQTTPADTHSRAICTVFLEAGLLI